MKKEEIIETMRKSKELQTILPPILQFLHPNFSCCAKCGLPWNWCKSKTVMHSPTSGTFATCDYCWDNSSLNEVKRYYTNTYKMQKRSLVGSEFSMDHTLEHLLNEVTKEYNLTH